MAADPNLEAGIAAVRAGDLTRAQQLLALAVAAAPRLSAVFAPPPFGPALMDRPDGYIGEVLGQAGTGAFTLEPGQSRDFQFQSTPPLPGERLGFNLYLIGPAGVSDGPDSGLRLAGWLQVDNLWAEVGLNWGAQQVADGVNYVTGPYNIFTTVSNPTGSPIEVLNLQIYINDAGAP